MIQRVKPHHELPNNGDAADRPNRHQICFRKFGRRLARPLIAGVRRHTMITRQGSFWLDEHETFGTTLGIESDKLESCIVEASSQRYRGVFGCPGFGFREATLDFLQRMPWLESIWFWDVRLTSIAGLHSLSKLKAFGVHPRRPAIDFSRFSDLSTLTIEPVRGDRGWEGLSSLKNFYLWHYKPKSKDFGSMLFPPALLKLHLNWINAFNLASIPPMPTVTHLEIHRSRNLSSLEELPDRFPNLSFLVVSACGAVDPEKGAKICTRLPKLQHASVQGRSLV